MTVTQPMPPTVARSPLWRVVVLGLVWAVSGELLILTVGYAAHRGFGSDAHAYWLAARHLSYVLPPRAVDAYLYSPLFADLLRPFGLLPWPVFYGLLTAANASALWWLLRPVPVRWAIPVAMVCGMELAFGNVHLLIAAAVVAGMGGSRAAWLFPVLTKVATGVGLVWYVAAGQWRRVGQVAGVFVVVVGACYLLQPTAWQAWVARLTASDSSTPDGAGSYLVRAVVAVLLVVVAARTESRWVVAVATMLANPVSVLSGIALLAAIPKLAGPELLTKSMGVHYPERVVADLLAHIHEADKRRRALQAEVDAFVLMAKRDGASWQRIGDALGVVRSAAFQKYAPRLQEEERP